MWECSPYGERESVHTYTTPAHSCSGILLFYGQEEKKMGRHTVWWSDEANGKWNVSVELQFPTFYLIGALSPGYFASYLMCVSFRHQYQDFKQIPCYLNVIWMDHSTAASAATYSFVLFFHLQTKYPHSRNSIRLNRLFDVMIAKKLPC